MEKVTYNTMSGIRLILKYYILLKNKYKFFDYSVSFIEKV